MRKLNNYLCVGLLINGIWLISSHFNLLPDFIEGLCVGAGLSLILMGLYAENHDISKLKNYKRTLLKKVFRK
ncbi:hypothetical protein [Clostridium fungisolvens]|uniref:Uncharacterized protein n=1 Tax=Clostridium fungisolvens TaxID=1604897 RepID=A0A6V8SDN5_9CLOT|nr:hypothetical protein [Clostridium fungisolvens]GFP75354.1 hypothetical protein bsdtw1_01428 [Clostridium fungisolvens]